MFSKFSSLAHENNMYSTVKLMFVYVPQLKFQQSNWFSQICLHNILFKTTVYVSFQYPTDTTKMTTEEETRTLEYTFMLRQATKIPKYIRNLFYVPHLPEYTTFFTVNFKKSKYIECD